MIPALIVPVLARGELLHRMLASLDYPVAQLLVIDNGHAVDEVPPHPLVQSCHVLKMPTNLGVATSWNLGIKALPFAPYWLIVNFDIIWPEGALSRLHREARPDALVLSAGVPPWCAFALGEQVVQRVGLFDEALHPGYFEDRDYQERCDLAKVPVINSGVTVRHDNSSTLDAGFRTHNNETFPDNYRYFQAKRADPVRATQSGEWSLDRRRNLSWD